MAKNKIKVKVIKDKYAGFKYNVQVWRSADGKNFYYSGYGRFCKDKKEVKAYIKAVYQTWYKDGYILPGRDFKYGKK